MLQLTHVPVLRYGFAALAVLMTLLLKLLLSSLMPAEDSFLLFGAAVGVSAWYGGLVAGFLATTLAVLVSDFFFLSPSYSFLNHNLGQNLSLVVFLLEGGLISWLIAALYSAKQRCEVYSLTLERSEQQLRQIAEHIRQVIWMSAPDMSQIFYVNPMYEEMWGRTTKSLYQQPTSFFKGIHPEDRDRVVAAFEKRTRDEYNQEYRVVRPDGSIRWVRSRVFPILNQTEQVYRLTGIVEDITDQKRIETELRQANERFQLAARAVNCAIYDWDIKQDRAEYTQGLMNLLGYSPEEVEPIDDWWWSRLHPDDVQNVREQLENALAQSNSFALEYRIRHRNNQYIYIADRGVIVRNAEEKAVRVVGCAIDLSDRKRAEEERVQLLACEQDARKQAEVASHMKDEFLAIVSHELRSPLNAILGWSQLLCTRKMDEKMTNRALEAIERNAKAQSQLIEDLLDISRIIRGKVRLYTRPLNLVQVIEAALDTVQPTANAKMIQLESRLDPNLGFVVGDPDRLQQIVWNLLSNAVKFTPEGGRIKVHLERVGTHARIQVSDTGKGISSDFLPYIFDRFCQGDSTTTRTHNGLGLGLAIVRNLVELHGGTIQAESPGEGQGATFTLALPLVAKPLEIRDLDQETHSKPVKCDRSSSLNGLKVLIVDDEIDAREFLVTVLHMHGADVTAAASASEALHLFHQLNPHVLVSDIRMPDEDGYTLIRKIRSLPPEQGGRIPSVALTSFARQEDRIKALSAGFQMHIAKPIEPKRLIEVVANFAQLSLRR